MYVVILLIILLILFLLYRREHLDEPILKISYDLDGYKSYVVYSDGSGDSNGNKIPADQNRLWAALKIINFPFEKINPCPYGPNPYTIEFQDKKYNIGCGPLSLYRLIASIASTKL
jgi:hypothetical protein